MRYLVLSDLHGGVEQLEQALSFFQKLEADFIVLLGDLLNHGPRNQLPQSYAPDKLAELLNAYATRIISVRGNCDSEVDSYLFNFPCNAPYSYLVQPQERGFKRFFLTHGHLYDFDNPQVIQKLGLKAGDIVLSGHTHVSGFFIKPNGVLNVNPGSLSLPKGGTQAGFVFIDDHSTNLYTLDGIRIESLAYY